MTPCPNIMRRLLCLTFITLSLLLMPALVFAADSNKLEFVWGIFLDAPAGPKSLSFKKAEKLKSGDTFQIYLKPQNNVYLYMYLVGTDKELTLIFPEQLYSLKTPRRDSPTTGTAYFIPMGEDRIELTPPGGTEKIYLLASIKKLEKLENLTHAHQQSPDDPAKRGAVIKELDHLKRSSSTLTEATSEGIPIAGTIFRSKSFGYPVELAHKVSAEIFYIKVLRIRHE